MTTRRTASLPTRLHLELTNRCNLECTTCVRTADPDPDSDLSVAEIQRLVQGLPDLDTVALQVNGEPLLYAELPAVLSLLDERGVRAELNTNGIALEGERIAWLLDNPLAQLNVSLDGATARTYRRLRAIDAFDRVVGNVQAFMRRRGPSPATPRVSLWITCTQHNIDEIPALVDLAARLGVDEVYLQRLVYFGFGEARAEASLHGKLTPDQIATLETP